MKIYIAGKIGGLKPYEYYARFGAVCSKLKREGHNVISPVELTDCLTNGKFDYADYMKICLAAVEVCDAIVMLDGWKNSPGATREYEKAKELGKQIIYEKDLYK